MKIRIKNTINEQWNTISEHIKGEVGSVANVEIRDGIKHFNVVFEVYGGMILGIPETVVDIVE